MSYLVKKVDDKKGDSFRLAVSWLEDGFTVTVLKGLNAYHASITKKYLKEQADLIKRDFAQYCENVRQYVEENNDNVSIKFKEAKRNFEVHYLIGSGSIKFFSIQLSESEYGVCVESIIDSLSTNNSQAFSQLGTLQVENASLKNELHQYKTKMEEFVSAKKLSDEKMLSNFVILLNEKKSRIQYLTELLEAFKGGREPANPPVKRSKKQSKMPKTQVANKPTKKEAISASESDEDSESPPEPMEDYNSEEEKIKCVADLAVPSTSKADFGFLKENSPPREIKIKSFKPKSAVNEKCYSITNNDSNVEKNQELNSKTETEKVTVASNLDFDTQDLLDEF